MHSNLKTPWLAPSCPSTPSWRGRFDFLVDRFSAVDYCIDISGVEDAFFVHFLYFLGIPLLLGMALQVVVDDAVEGGVLHGSHDFLPALNALALI